MFDLDDFLTTSLPPSTRFGMLMYQPEGTKAHPYPHYVCSLFNSSRERLVVPTLAYGYGKTPALAAFAAVAEWNASEKRYLNLQPKSEIKPALTLSDLGLDL